MSVLKLEGKRSMFVNIEAGGATHLIIGKNILSKIKGAGPFP